jgi:hypothetical protein
MDTIPFGPGSSSSLGQSTIANHGPCAQTPLPLSAPLPRVPPVCARLLYAAAGPGPPPRAQSAWNRPGPPLPSFLLSPPSQLPHYPPPFCFLGRPSRPSPPSPPFPQNGHAWCFPILPFASRPHPTVKKPSPHRIRSSHRRRFPSSQ